MPEAAASSGCPASAGSSGCCTSIRKRRSGSASRRGPSAPCCRRTGSEPGRESRRRASSRVPSPTSGAGRTQAALCWRQPGPPMYDHNQTLVPDSFMALHVLRGKAVLSREQTEARYEICEDLALHTAAFLAASHQDGDDADDALRRCDAGLRADPSLVSAAEAAWVIER